MQVRDSIKELESQIDEILSESSLYAELSDEEKRNLIEYLCKYFTDEFKAPSPDSPSNPSSMSAQKV